MTRDSIENVSVGHLRFRPLAYVVAVEDDRPRANGGDPTASLFLVAQDGAHFTRSRESLGPLSVEHISIYETSNRDSINS